MSKTCLGDSESGNRPVREKSLYGDLRVALGVFFPCNPRFFWKTCGHRGSFTHTTAGEAFFSRQSLHWNQKTLISSFRVRLLREFRRQF